MKEFVHNLQTRLQPLRSRYHLLTETERWSLIVFVWVVMIALVISLVWLPAMQWRDQQQQAYDNGQELIEWMKQKGPLVAGANRGGAVARRGDQSLVSVVVQVAQSTGVALQRYEPQGEGEVRVWLSEVKFDLLMSWLSRLKMKNGIIVSNIVIEQKTDPGLVKATVVLSG